VHAAVEGIAQACVPDPDQMLHDLLASAIGECATWCGGLPGLSTGHGAALIAAAH
jgi:hypothetical protein